MVKELTESKWKQNSETKRTSFNTNSLDRHTVPICETGSVMSFGNVTVDVKVLYDWKEDNEQKIRCVAPVSNTQLFGGNKQEARDNEYVPLKHETVGLCCGGAAVDAKSV